MTADGAAAAAEMVPERIVRRRTWIGVRWEDLGGEKRDGQREREKKKKKKKEKVRESRKRGKFMLGQMWREEASAYSEINFVSICAPLLLYLFLIDPTSFLFVINYFFG